MQRIGNGIMKNKYPKFKTIEDIFKAKQTHHKRMAKLPIKKKIEGLVNIQRMCNRLNPQKKKYRVWEI